MADSGKNATQTHTGDGTAGPFAVGFSFLEQADILVNVTGASPERRVLNTHYTVDSSTEEVTFIAPFPAAVADNIVFRRKTGSSLITTPTDGASLTAANLINLINQTIYIGEEIEDANTARGA
ncbi:MAG: hypothetical protein GY701_28780 [Sulfitobacter sp.]|nr:hypothetical protein [Sulfitobacter sp.]